MVLENYIANDYFRSAAIAIVIIILARILVGIVLKTAAKLTSKTKTDLDDVIIKRASTPLTLIIFLLAIEIPLRELPLEESVELLMSKIILSAVIVVVGYLVFILFDMVVLNGWNKFMKKTKTKIDEALVKLIQQVLKYILIILILLYLLDFWGIQIGLLLAGLGIAGLAIALALQPVLANIFSGISMILDKSLRVGDLVYLDATNKGKVEHIGLRSTKLRTFDNELIIVPNT